MSRIAIILALPAEYNTSSMLRCRAIINAMVELGHSIKCYMPYPDENSKYYSAMLNIKDVEIFRYGKIIKTGSFALATQTKRQSIKSMIKKFAHKAFKKIDVFGATLLYLPERKKISKDINKNDFEYLISFSDPMPAHMIGKYCKRHNAKLKYIQQWGDPLASDTISKTAQPVWLRKIIENSLLRPADRICYVSPFTNDEQKAFFPRHAGKMIFLPTPSLEYNSEKITENNKRLCLGYFGSYNSVARNLLPFYKVAIRTPDVEFFIIGDSDLLLESTANVHVLQRISQEELEVYMKKTDVIICLMNHKGNQIPGKVYHDASSTKDILFIKDGEYGDEIEKFFSKYNHYTFVNNSEDDISKAIVNYKTEGVPVRKPVVEFTALSIAEDLLS
ncbi:MAG: hypothetical protein ACLRQR_04995 [Merdimonas faecis]|uniref:hypothetical protein n=1 Tax=Merdimonas faecis TaxID=1653435 RepID=UPI0039906C39